ncbi:N-acetyltransferase family 8 member 3 [Nelusetta ayraudi]|uniref:N-acetyltransferase family 8 member 3 n=1 Tax=Nelusetta ayraudi TaxID=303726 RepID=UPI003F70856C
MAQKNNCPVTIREFTPSDKHVVLSLFRNGVLEHIYPAFFRSMSNPDHLGVFISLSVAGYVLGGSSYFQALLFGGAWAAFIYHCCREVYEGYLAGRLRSDMADIQASYLERPDSGLWLAELEVNGKVKVVGMVAASGRRPGGDRLDDCNGGVAGRGPDGGDDGGCYCEMSHLVVLFPWRRKSLGSQLTGRVLDFCKERGYSRLVLDVSSPQDAAVSLCRKLGFAQTSSHSDTHANRLFSTMARINVMRMEKVV